MSTFQQDPMDVGSEQQATPVADLARSTHSDNQDFPWEVIGITIVGFLMGVVLSPFKGELLVGFAASVAFTIWLIWSRRVRGGKLPIVALVAMWLVAVTCLFAGVGYLHTKINY